ncbi:MAG TPA: hypothetical protein PK006_13495 [Saprospiraceae bacterium]|nr:hypothetical protein [Saprospiraceae bacterium]
MILNITGLVLYNSIHNIKLGQTTIEVINSIKLLNRIYKFHKQRKNNSYIVMEDLQLFFTTGKLEFCIIPIWGGSMVNLFDIILNKNTTLFDFEEILISSKIGYSTKEIEHNDHFSIIINNTIFIFGFTEKKYLLNKIQWGCTDFF